MKFEYKPVINKDQKTDLIDVFVDGVWIGSRRTWVQVSAFELGWVMADKRRMKVRLGVPKLGILTEIYDFNDPSSCETLDKNVANGCLIISIKPAGEFTIQSKPVERDYG